MRWPMGDVRDPVERFTSWFALFLVEGLAWKADNASVAAVLIPPPIEDVEAVRAVIQLYIEVSKGDVATTSARFILKPESPDTSRHDDDGPVAEFIEWMEENVGFAGPHFQAMIQPIDLTDDAGAPVSLVVGMRNHQRARVAQITPARRAGPAKRAGSTRAAGHPVSAADWGPSCPHKRLTTPPVRLLTARAPSPRRRDGKEH